MVQNQQIDWNGCRFCWRKSGESSHHQLEYNLWICTSHWNRWHYPLGLQWKSFIAVGLVTTLKKNNFATVDPVNSIPESPPVRSPFHSLGKDVFQLILG